MGFLVPFMEFSRYKSAISSSKTITEQMSTVIIDAYQWRAVLFAANPKGPPNTAGNLLAIFVYSSILRLPLKSKQSIPSKLCFCHISYDNISKYDFRS